MANGKNTKGWTKEKGSEIKDDKYELLIKRYKEIQDKLKLLENYKEKIRKLIEKCLEKDNIDTISRNIDGEQWVARFVTRKSKKVDYSVLLEKGIYEEVVKEIETRYLNVVSIKKSEELEIPEIAVM